MGWLFTHGQTRAELIRHLIRAEDGAKALHVTLCHCVRGNVLWTVREVTPKTGEHGCLPGFPQRYIGCDLLACRRGFGWGYKDLCERMGPLYYHCPLPYLDMVPEENADWRAAVRAWHARRARPIAIGEIWSLMPSCSVRAVEIVSLRPLRGRGRPNGVLYRLTRDLLDVQQTQIESEPDSPQLPLPALLDDQATT